MKPSWNDAPEWANYLAMDSDGSWWWLNNKPLLRNGAWFPANCDTDRLELADCVDDLSPILEKRPEEKR